uniref:Uncharacterized protein n=1 Tax=Lactuca sativa TaxID=4236 RepID=A0A9R1VJD1_LACSA|nr:hypothetical protein LSAT_V11C500268720 [Lactuca sativa]
MGKIGEGFSHYIYSPIKARCIWNRPMSKMIGAGCVSAEHNAISWMQARFSLLLSSYSFLSYLSSVISYRRKQQALIPPVVILNFVVFGIIFCICFVIHLLELKIKQKKVEAKAKKHQEWET